MHFVRRKTPLLLHHPQTYVSSALVASPCCTLVLASILGFIASSRDPYLGFALLLVYSAGYTTPLMAVGTASGVLSRLMSAKGLKWITPANGAVLISYGTYSGLDALFGQALGRGGFLLAS